MADLLMIVPSRGRPDSIAELWDSWQATTTSGNADLLIAVDEDDETLPRYQEHADRLGFTLRVGKRLRLAGTLNEVAAENWDRYPMLGFWGDDNRPRTIGWDGQLIAALRELRTGVAYGNDLLQGERMPTAVVMTSDIPKTLGYMSFPGSVHLCLDLAWLDWGQRIGRIKYLPDTVIEHLHPANGKSTWDDTYADCNSPERNATDHAAYMSYKETVLPADIEKLQKLFLRLDIGGGHTPAPGHVNLDSTHGKGKFRRQVQDGIPLADGTVDSARASHVLEHIPTEHRIFVMNEVHRVLKPGGTFEVILPLFPSWQAMADPTHVSFWVAESFDYFTGEKFAQADYGIRHWRKVSWEVRDGWEAHCVLTPA